MRSPPWVAVASGAAMLSVSLDGLATRQMAHQKGSSPGPRRSALFARQQRTSADRRPGASRSNVSASANQSEGGLDIYTSIFCAAIGRATLPGHQAAVRLSENAAARHGEEQVKCECARRAYRSVPGPSSVAGSDRIKAFMYPLGGYR